MQYLSPHNQQSLRKAFIKGNIVWYCPESRGRLLTFVAAKNLIGEHDVQSLWINAKKSSDKDWKKCPSCNQPLSLASIPNTTNENPPSINICTSCRLFWIDQGKIKNLVEVEDFTNKHGDASQYYETVKDLSETLFFEHKLKNSKEEILGDGPEEIHKKFFAFMGLPVEMETPLGNEIPWVTYFISLVCLISVIVTSFFDIHLSQSWGFIPDDAGRNLGITIFTSNLLHGGWLHLIGNLYFFLFFANDVEEHIGHKKFIILFISTALFIAFASKVLSSRGDIPMIGLSGFVSAIIAYYGLTFRNHRIAFHYFGPWGQNNRLGGVGRSWSLASAWIRLPAYWLILAFFIKEIAMYLFLERDRLTYVAHSAHISGFIVGVLFYSYWERSRTDIVKV